MAAEVALRHELVDDDVEHRAGREASRGQQRLGDLEGGEGDQRRGGSTIPVAAARRGEIAVVADERRAGREPFGDVLDPDRQRDREPRSSRRPRRRRRRRPPRARCGSSAPRAGARPAACADPGCGPAPRSACTWGTSRSSTRSTTPPTAKPRITSVTVPRSRAGTSRLKAVAASMIPAVKPSRPSRRRSDGSRTTRARGRRPRSRRRRRGSRRASRRLWPASLRGSANRYFPTRRIGGRSDSAPAEKGDPHPG